MKYYSLDDSQQPEHADLLELVEESSSLPSRSGVMNTSSFLIAENQKE